MTQEIESRMALKDLVDRYATESDKNNQNYYRNLFRPDVKLKVYMGDNTFLSGFAGKRQGSVCRCRLFAYRPL